jgi:hypothetical protein
VASQENQDKLSNLAFVFCVPDLSMRTTPQVSGLGLARWVACLHCAFYLPRWAHLLLLGSAHHKVAPCRARLDTGGPFTLPSFLPRRARPGLNHLILWQCKRGFRILQTFSLHPSKININLSTCSAFEIGHHSIIVTTWLEWEILHKHYINIH